MSMRNVLGVLEDREDRLWSTFDAAVDLADHEHARLTLVKTFDPGHFYMWCGPFAVGGIYVPPEEDPNVTAGRLLARAAEFVPAEIPVTTMVLGIDTERQLRKLVDCGAYDALVADEHLLKHARRLRKELAKQHVAAVPVHPHPGCDPAHRLSATSATDATPAPAHDQGGAS